MELRDVIRHAVGRRTATGWMLFALLAGLVGFYLLVVRAMLSPTVDEAYRRTYLTREFGAYPTSAFFQGDNGLAYRPGERLDFTLSRDRLRLSRFDWKWQFGDAASLVGHRGRLFVHLPPETRRPDVPHRVRFGFACRPEPDVPTSFVVEANGSRIGAFDCAGRSGIVTVEAVAPAGTLGTLDYEEIAVERAAGGWRDRALTRLGDRLAMFGIAWLEIEPEAR